MSTILSRETMWFLDTAVVVHHHATDQRPFSLLEARAHPGSTVPLHIHHDEDEVFTVLEGELTVLVGEHPHVLPAGRSATAPMGVPHSYRVSSNGGARWLVLTSPGRFEAFVRALARPAEGAGLPEAVAPSAEQVAHLAETALEHGIEILGPPPFAS